MKNFLNVAGLGFGLTLGGGLVYALYTSDSARLMAAFLLGAFIFGGVVLLTVIMVNRQWTRAMGDQRTTNNHRYQVYSQQPGWTMPAQRPQELLPLPDVAMWGAPVDTRQDVNDEVVA